MYPNKQVSTFAFDCYLFAHFLLFTGITTSCSDGNEHQHIGLHANDNHEYQLDCMERDCVDYQGAADDWDDA